MQHRYLKKNNAYSIQVFVSTIIIEKIHVKNYLPPALSVLLNQSNPSQQAFTALELSFHTALVTDYTP